MQQQPPLYGFDLSDPFGPLSFAGSGENSQGPQDLLLCDVEGPEEDNAPRIVDRPVNRTADFGFGLQSATGPKGQARNDPIFSDAFTTDVGIYGQGVRLVSRNGTASVGASVSTSASASASILSSNEGDSSSVENINPQYAVYCAEVAQCGALPKECVVRQIDGAFVEALPLSPMPGLRDVRSVGTVERGIGCPSQQPIQQSSRSGSARSLGSLGGPSKRCQVASANQIVDDLSSLDSASGLQLNSRRPGVTLYGGKVELFSTALDTTPQRHVSMRDLVDRGRTSADFCRRPQPRPAPDFRQTEAWQRAYAQHQCVRRQRSQLPWEERRHAPPVRLLNNPAQSAFSNSGSAGFVRRAVSHTASVRGRGGRKGGSKYGRGRPGFGLSREVLAKLDSDAAAADASVQPEPFPFDRSEQAFPRSLSPPSNEPPSADSVRHSPEPMLPPAWLDRAENPRQVLGECLHSPDTEKPTHGGPQQEQRNWALLSSSRRIHRCDDSEQHFSNPRVEEPTSNSEQRRQQTLDEARFQHYLLQNQHQKHPDADHVRHQSPSHMHADQHLSPRQQEQLQELQAQMQRMPSPRVDLHAKLAHQGASDFGHEVPSGDPEELFSVPSSAPTRVPSSMQSPRTGSEDTNAGCRVPPQTHEVPLREMQRLLGETWKYHQRGELGAMLGNLLETNPDSTSQSRFANADLEQFGANGPLGMSTPRAPPPICSDLLEVRAVNSNSAKPSVPSSPMPSTPHETPGRQQGSDDGCYPTGEQVTSSPGYVFLGRLVATLPEDEAHSIGLPCPPQAVVECNFWQLRGSGGKTCNLHVPQMLEAPTWRQDSGYSSEVDVELGAGCSSEVTSSITRESLADRRSSGADGRGEDGMDSEYSFVGPSMNAVSGFSKLEHALRMLPPRPSMSSTTAGLESDEDFPPWPHEM